jgi:hypothetical protein
MSCTSPRRGFAGQEKILFCEGLKRRRGGVPRNPLRHRRARRPRCHRSLRHRLAHRLRRLVILHPPGGYHRPRGRSDLMGPDAGYQRCPAHRLDGEGRILGYADHFVQSTTCHRMQELARHVAERGFSIDRSAIEAAVLRLRKTFSWPRSIRVDHWRRRGLGRLPGHRRGKRSGHPSTWRST